MVEVLSLQDIERLGLSTRPISKIHKAERYLVLDQIGTGQIAIAIPSSGLERLRLFDSRGRARIFGGACNAVSYHHFKYDTGAAVETHTPIEHIQDVLREHGIDLPIETGVATRLSRALGLSSGPAPAAPSP